MKLSKRFTRSDFFIKLTNWEYWPFGIVQFPLFFYYFWLSIRARSLLFFTATNPGIAMGGMFGESKFAVLEKIDPRYKPTTLLVEHPAEADAVLLQIHSAGLKLPLIAKPDLGERGFMVERITSPEELDDYIHRIGVDFMVQELVALPLEYGVFYRKYPGAERGEVTSVVGKEMLAVCGDGMSTLRQLILAKDRAKIHWKTLSRTHASLLDHVLARGENMELVSIGNHCRGAKFINANALINEHMSQTFDLISNPIDGFYFGRFDLRCASEEDLYTGNVRILELNGCGAEPAHIYDPDYKLIDALGVLFRHWRDIFEIAVENRRRGEKVLTLREGLHYYKKFKAAVR